MAALSGFCALRHFDLKLIGGIEVLRGNAEASACDLFDGRAFILLAAFCL